MTERFSMASKATELGKDTAKLSMLKAKVLEEINALPNFCKLCKPKKMY